MACSFVRDALPLPEKKAILLHAPPEGLRIEVGDIDEILSLYEALLHVSHEALDGSFRERMRDTAQLRPEAEKMLERIIVVVVDHVPCRIAA